MAFDGSGNFNNLYSFVTEQSSPPIEIAKLDAQFDDIADALSNCILRDGTGLPTENISLNGKKITNLATPTASTDAATKAYVDGSTGSFTASLRIVAGGTVYGTGTVYYKVSNGMAHLWVTSDVTGDGASLTALVMTGAPAAVQPSVSRKVKCGGIIQKSSSGRQGGATINTSAELTFWRDTVSGVEVIETTSFQTSNFTVTGVQSGWCISYPL